MAAISWEKRVRWTQRSWQKISSPARHEFAGSRKFKAGEEITEISCQA